MAFTPDTLSLSVDTIGGSSLRIHFYTTADPLATVCATAYFTRAAKIGLRLGDMLVVRSDVSGTFLAEITAINAAGAATATSEVTETQAMIDAMILNDDDMSLSGNLLPARNNVKDWVEWRASHLWYDLAATMSFPASVQTLNLNGRKSFGDRAGKIPVKRVALQPTTHNGWLRTADRFLPNGTVDDTNGGYWEFNVGDFANVCAFGAVANGTTNDHPAIQGAINYLNAKWATGQVYFPGANGPYLCTSTIEIAGSSITMFGATQLTTIHSGTADICLIKVIRRECTIRDLNIYGKGIWGLPTSDTEIGASAPTVWVTDTAVNTMIDHCRIFGGFYALRMEGGDSKVYRCEVSRAYGFAMVYADNGHYFIRNAMDQSWPVGLPAYGEVPNPIPAWSAGATVAVKDVVQIGNYLVQCRVAGTTGGTTPTLKNYLVDIDDGATVKWRLVCNQTYWGFRLGPTAQEISISHQDLSGCLTVGIGVVSSNTNLRLKVRDAIVGQTLKQAFLIEGGKDIKLWKNHTGCGFQANFAAIQISGNVSGHVSIDDNWIEGGNRGVWIALATPGTASVDVHRNYIKPNIGVLGTSAIGIEAGAGQTDFDIDGNTLAAGCVDGVVIGAGCDYYQVTKTKNKARLADADYIQGVVPGPNIYVQGNT